MKLTSILAALGLCCAITASSDAEAARVYGCSVSEVQWDGWKRLRIICDNIDYWAETNSACPNSQGIDTLRQWQALATSALLSGKKMDLYYDTSTTNPNCGRRLGTAGLLK